MGISFFYVPPSFSFNLILILTYIADMAVLDKNFEQMKPMVPVERLEQMYL